MALVAADQAAEIRKEFEDHLAGDVRLTLVGPSALEPPARDLTREIRQLLSELAALSPHISLEYVDVPSAEQRAALGMAPDEGGPLTVVSGAAKGKVRFVGAPSGHEFPSLVRAILDVSRGTAEALSASSRAALASIARPVHIRVFFTPT